MEKIEQLIHKIREAEKSLHDLESQLSQTEVSGDRELQALQQEINSDILYIKSVYTQLLRIRSRAELLMRQSDDPDAKEVSEKVHRAFLMLVEYNKQLEGKIAAHRKLLNEREKILQVCLGDTITSDIAKAKKELSKLSQELRAAEAADSVPIKAKNRVMKELQKRQELANINAELADFYAEAPLCMCGQKMILRIKDGDVFWGCSDYYNSSKKHSKTIQFNGNKEKYLYLKEKKDSLKIETQSSSVFFKKEEQEALQQSTVPFDCYPSIVEKSYSNYLFQSLEIPHGVTEKEHLDELLKYSRFRIFTELPQKHVPNDKARTIYSLALRLLNRGVVLHSNVKTEAKIKRYFGENNTHTFLSTLNNYISYRSPQIKHDSPRETEFAARYFPQALGNAWATYVYPQMPLNALLTENEAKQFLKQRVDFFVCYEGKKLVIELDGKEDHQEKIENDKNRDSALKRNGYDTWRISNDDVDENAEWILPELQKRLASPPVNSSLVTYGKKHLIACKIVHQVAIAIVKMLEEGRIFPRCNLNLEISDDSLFSVEEQKLLLMIAVEEITELLENFATLYGTKLDLNFFDKYAESYWIQIGDGDNNRNSIVIRDIVLPWNYLCSIHPFSLIMPEKEAVTEEVLEYFLKYVYGYGQFKPGQFAAIRRALRQEESIVLLPTGSGKSVIYQLSSMLLPGITVVISPLKALIRDQVNNLADKGINNVAFIMSADEKSKAIMREKAKAVMENHSAMMLYIAPERMQMPDFRNEIKGLLETNNFCLVAIDEAHCVSEWGHDFRAAYLQIGRSCRNVFGKNGFAPPIVALTGTASDNVLKDVKRDLEILNEDAIISPPSFDRPELHYFVISCDTSEKLAEIKKLLDHKIPQNLKCLPEDFKALRGKKTAAGIIFTPLAQKKNSIHAAWHIFNQLNEPSNDLHIGTYFCEVPRVLSQQDKQDVWQQIIESYSQEFKDNQKQLLVATKAYGMGIDKSNIRYVIHCGLSSSIEQYYQEVGRAGRDRAHAECFMLFSDASEEQIEKILDPNLEWSEFQNEYEQLKKAAGHFNKNIGDIDPMLFFHSNNFQGTFAEKQLIFAVLKSLDIKKKKEEFNGTGVQCERTATDIYTAYLNQQPYDSEFQDSSFFEAFDQFLQKAKNPSSRADAFSQTTKRAKNNPNQNDVALLIAKCLTWIANTPDKELAVNLWKNDIHDKTSKELEKQIVIAVLRQNPKTSRLYKYLSNSIIDETVSNDIAKAIIRLVTLGIIKDYTYDFNRKKYTLTLGSVQRSDVQKKYLQFVEGCNRDKVNEEKRKLGNEKCDELHFIVTVVENYVNLVYGTIEKGRRRALRSMYDLAKAASQKRTPEEQDKYIRGEIENYLLMDDVTELVKNAASFEEYVHEITKAYPLYSEDVIIDPIEQANAKKTYRYAGRMLENEPDHTGLLYLHAITAIKSRDYRNKAVVTDIIAAYQNSLKSCTFEGEETTFLVQTINLVFNASHNLFEFLWNELTDRTDDKYFVKHIISKLEELGSDVISQNFKDYLLLHITTNLLRKMTGDQ